MDFEKIILIKNKKESKINIHKVNVELYIADVGGYVGIIYDVYRVGVERIGLLDVWHVALFDAHNNRIAGIYTKKVEVKID